MVYGNTVTGTEYKLTTTDIMVEENDEPPLLTLPGRLIGFGVTFAKNTRGDNLQLMRISVIYNNCNCYGSSFLRNSPPTPLRIVAGVTGEQF